MGKKDLMRKTLAVGIVSLFIITSVTPMVIGFDTEDTKQFSEIDKTLANLRYMCTDETGFSEEKYEYYKEKLLNYNSNDEVVIEKETDKTVVKDDLSSIVSLGPINSSWPMKCHDTYHTGRSPIGTMDNPYNELWRYAFDRSMPISPAIGRDGIIYLGGSYEKLRRYLFAIYPNGTLNWRYRMDGFILGSCPAIAEDGTIYIGAWDECLHAVNPNGTRKWEFDTGLNIASSPAIADDGTIYFGTFDGAWTDAKIYAINPDGTEKWHYDTGWYIMSDPAIGDDGTIYIGSADDYLYAMYPNGTLRWRYKTGDWVRGPVSIADDGTIYFGSWDYYLYALHPNGTLRWKTEIWYGSETNPTIGDDGTIYISSASKLFAINPDDGDIIWEFNLGGHSGKSSSPICADGIIYTGIEIGDRDGGEIVAVNSDGMEHWRQRLSNHDADSSPAIGSDGTIYICSTSSLYSEQYGYLHAFGQIQTNEPPEEPIITVPPETIVRNDRVCYISGVDPDNNPVSFEVDWGDGSDIQSFGTFASGENRRISHIYQEKGTYYISAKTIDVMGEESNWSIPIPINITGPRIWINGIRRGLGLIIKIENLENHPVIGVPLYVEFEYLGNPKWPRDGTITRNISMIVNRKNLRYFCYGFGETYIRITIDGYKDSFRCSLFGPFVIY